MLAIDAERERISLGIKQLDKDPFSSWLAEHPKNSIVKGTVTEVDARFATVDLGDGVIGTLRASELARGRVEDARTVLKVGEEVEAKFTNVDRKNRSVRSRSRRRKFTRKRKRFRSTSPKRRRGIVRHHARRTPQGEDVGRIEANDEIAWSA